MSTSLTLSNGVVMPTVGLGTWKSKTNEVRDAVYEAIRAGYRHIDAAWIYQNQDEVGEGIQKAISEGIVTRGDLFVTTKLWNDKHKREDVEPHLRDSLKQLKLDYVDLYLIHWPVTDQVGETLTPTIEETWGGMEAIYEKGLAKAIGVSNFSISKLTAMKSYAKVFPMANQVELHPYCRQDDLVAECKKLGVALTAYCPLGSPDSAIMFNKESIKLLEHPVVTAVAKETGRTAGQVLIRWAVQRGTIVIPKSVTPSRIVQNLDVYSFDLTSEQMANLSSISEQKRACDGSFWVNPAGPYRSMEELWA